VATTRITVTLEESVAAELRAKVPAGDVSAFVLAAIRERLRVDPMRALLEDLDEVYGPLTDQDKVEGERWWNDVEQRLSLTQEPS
jgi:hypothetical protein